MARSKGLARSWLPTVGWTAGSANAGLGALVWGLPAWVNRGAEQITGLPTNTAAGGLTPGFVESQVAVFWWAVSLIALLTIAFLFAAWLHGSSADARSIARGRGRRPLSWMPIALVIVGGCATLSGIPRAVFDPVDPNRLNIVSPLVGFAQRSPVGAWILAICVTLICAVAGWALIRFAWLRAWRGWQLSQYVEVVGRADA